MAKMARIARARASLSGPATISSSPALQHSWCTSSRLRLARAFPKSSAISMASTFLASCASRHWRARHLVFYSLFRPRCLSGRKDP